MLITYEAAQSFWQKAYDELVGATKTTVPVAPELTRKQRKSLDGFGFLPVYIPTLTEDEYPPSFIKPAWGASYLMRTLVQRIPLKNSWVAFETITKPEYTNPGGYQNDKLMSALNHKTRFGTSYDELTKGGLLTKTARMLGFKKKDLRCPTVEEWNFIANLFNWLRETRTMTLPDLGSTSSWEWCENLSQTGRHLMIGSTGGGCYGRGNTGLHRVEEGWLGGFAFRVLVVL